MHAHFVGVGGIGMSALAQWLLADGWTVTGADRDRTDVTSALERLGALWVEGEATVPEGVTLLVYSDAVPADHPARRVANAQGIPERSYAELLGRLTEALKTIAVAGSHGKSTTTALLGLLLESAGLDPTVVVGTKVPKWERRKEKGLPGEAVRRGFRRGSASPRLTAAPRRMAKSGELFTLGNYRRGGSDIAVVEADEYRKHFLALKPMIGVVTTVDHDHVDAFPTPADYAAAFREFVAKIPSGGSLALPADDDSVSFLRSSVPAGVRLVTFAVGPAAADVVATPPRVDNGAQRFTLAVRGKPWGEFLLLVPGAHVVRNLAAAVAAALPFDLTPETLRLVLRDFRGTWRRFEHVGTLNGAPVISDYAHHPTELRALFAAARQWYPKRRLVVVFQPHQRARTRAFARQFLEVLREPDGLILTEVYDVAGREERGNETSTRSWVDQLTHHRRTVVAVAGLAEAEAAVRASVRPDDVVLIVGAGDIDTVARRLVTRKIPDAL